MSSVDIKQKIKEEWKRCAKDIVYFMRKYVYIQHPIKGKIKFDLYPFQEDVLKQLQENNKSIILKSRQMGISTLCAGYILWLMVFNSDKNCIIVSKTQDAAKEVITKVRYGNDNLPSWMKVESMEDNRLSLRLKNGSQVKSVSSSKDSVRSAALSFLMIDEAQFIDEAENIWISAQPALATGGRSVILSTPEGVGSFFHKTWVDSVADKNGIHPIELMWDLHPERDENWKQRQLTEIGPKKFAQEFGCNFGASGNTVISDETLKKYEDFSLDPVEKRGIGNNLWIFKRAQAGRRYLVSADVGRGDSEDYSAAHITDLDSLEQVAEFECKLPTSDYGDFLVALATEYNDAVLVIENNNIGWATIQRVIERKYRNLFYMTNDMKYVDVEEQMTNRLYSQDKKMVPGFSTTPRTRPLIIAKLEEYMRSGDVKLNSKRLISQLRTFIWKNGKAQAEDGYNDDLVMSLCIGLWVRDTALVLQQRGNELTRLMLDKISSSNTGIQKISGEGGSGGIYRSTGKIQDPWKTDIGGISEDLRWLIR